jgi:uroporphyrinogen III methyltransferase/synthase
VRWATRPDQETLSGTLATLPVLIAERGMKPPATIIVGEVVRLREKLDWYERLPLFGKRIVVTRAKGQADALSAKLRALGAEAIELPTIEIRPAADYSALDRAIADLGSYDWLIFTSVNGVRFFLDRLRLSPVDWRALRARICAIGPATRAAVEALHLKVDLMGKEYVAEGLLAAFAPYDLAGTHVLLPRAAVARDLVPTELARRGARVDVVEAYRTVLPEEAAARCREILASRRRPDCITFTSSSTVQNFVAAMAGGAEVAQAVPPAFPARFLAGMKVASIGPITSQTARELGIDVTAQARVFTVDGLVEAVLEMCIAVPG